MLNIAMHIYKLNTYCIHRVALSWLKIIVVSYIKTCLLRELSLSINMWCVLQGSFFRSSFVCHCDLPSFSTKLKYTLYDTSLLFNGLNVNDMPDVGS